MQRLLAPLQARQTQHLAAGLRGLVHDARPMHTRAAGGPVQAPRVEMRQGQAHVTGELLNQAVF